MDLDVTLLDIARNSCYPTNSMAVVGEPLETRFVFCVGDGHMLRCLQITDNMRPLWDGTNQQWQQQQQLIYILVLDLHRS